MLYKLKNQSPLYQVWAVSIAICAIYLLCKYFFSELTSLDRMINVFLWFSIVADALFFPIKKDKD